MLTISCLITAVLFLSIGTFVLRNNTKSSPNVSFFLLCLTTFGWQFSWFVIFAFPDPWPTELLVRIGYSFIIFIPITYLHFLISFLGKKDERLYVNLSYAAGAVFLLSLWASRSFINGYYDYSWGHYPKAGNTHPLYLVFLCLLTLKGLSLLASELKLPLSVNRRNQVRYVLIALLFYIPASSDFLVNYGFNFQPLGFLFIAMSLVTVAYSIARHNLMDIEVVIRRTAVFAGLFAFVYGTFTVVTILGQEFFRNTLGWNPWVAMVPTVVIITFALRPLEVFLTNVTERFLFQKKYDFRELLRTFTNEILTILDRQKLMEETVAGLMRIVKLESACVLLLDKDRKIYRAVASSGLKEKGEIIFSESDTLISYLKATHEPILKDKSADKIEGDGALKGNFKTLNARLCLPILLHDSLIGVLGLGMKKSGEDYSREDMDILMTLARAEAIAVSNAQLFDELSKTQAEAAQREKMAVIGTLAAGINHEICNPLGIVRGHCEMFLLNLRDGFYQETSREELLKIASEIMDKVIRETDRATAITKKLSSFAKPSKRADFEEVEVPREVDEVLGLVGHDLKLNNISIEKNFVLDFPVILADKKQIQEVLFNIIRNAAQAMDKKEGRIVVSGLAENGSAVVKISDNGTGIPEEKLGQIFHPFYTTKAPDKGTGLGLFIVKQVVERNKGAISVESRSGVGTTFMLRFPRAAGLTAAER
jgi:signal transduction histidine kinase